jgi:hypothetical protein
LLLAGDGVEDIGAMLIADQFFAAITSCESGNLSDRILVDSAYQVTSYADVKPSAMFVGHDVNPEIVVSRHSEIFRLGAKTDETNLIFLKLS